MSKTTLIEYKGRKLNTTHYKEIDDQLYKDIKDFYFKRPDFKDVMDEFALMYAGGVTNSNITRYYFRDLMAKVQLHSCNWTVEDVFEYKPLGNYFYSLIFGNDKVFPPDDGVFRNFERAFHIGGIGVARRPSNYPIDSVYEILERYNVNNNWYDMSCGWGARLTGALAKQVNYFGTDPNYLLTKRLQQLTNDWRDVTKLKSTVDIRTTGSEIFHEDWVNKMGLCFTSPPYFFLEDYKIGNQSYKEGMSYHYWLDNFMKPTIKNCHKYLTDDGILAININNFKSKGVEYKLFEDTFMLAQQNGFTHIENIVLKINERPNALGGTNDNSEQIMVFMKQGCEHLFKNRMPEVFDIFYFMGDAE